MYIYIYILKTKDIGNKKYIFLLTAYISHLFRSFFNVKTNFKNRLKSNKKMLQIKRNQKLSSVLKQNLNQRKIFVTLAILVLKDERYVFNKKCVF